MHFNIVFKKGPDRDLVFIFRFKSAHTKKLNHSVRFLNIYKIYFIQSYILRC